MILHALSLGSLLVATGAFAPPQEAPGSNLVVEPAEVRAGMFYSGATIRVTADVQSGLGVSLSLVGEEGPLELKRKGKVLGLIWMSVGEVTFDPMPHVYLLASSSELADLADAATLSSAGVGYEALKARARPGDSFLFQEAIRFKESEGLYGVLEGGVRLEPIGDGLVRAEAEFVLPAKAPIGKYRILLHGFAPEGATLLAQDQVEVVKTGSAAFISDLAETHGLAYGVFAVGIAIGVGLITGILFGLGSKKGH